MPLLVAVKKINYSKTVAIPRQNKTQNKIGFYVRGVFTTLLNIKSEKWMPFCSP